MKRILVVEDDGCVLELIRKTLESQGHEVLSARNGMDAVKLGTQVAQPLDLLLCDLVIPGLGAGDVIRAVASTHPLVKIVIITGHPSESVPLYGVTGRFCVLEKPFSIRKLDECATCLEEVQSCGSEGKDSDVDS